MTTLLDTRDYSARGSAEEPKHSSISPELALVDPELAAAARGLLPGPGRFRPASDTHLTAPGTAHGRLRPPAAAPPASAAARPRTQRARRTVTRVALSAAAAAIAVGAVGAAVFQWHRAPSPVSALAPRTALGSHAARRERTARTYTWPAVPGAHTYRVRVLRGNQRVWEATTSTPAVELPAGLHLSPGRYTWSATPGFEEPLLDAAARPVVEQTFQVSS